MVRTYPSESPPPRSVHSFIDNETGRHVVLPEGHEDFPGGTYRDVYHDDDDLDEAEEVED